MKQRPTLFGRWPRPRRPRQLDRWTVAGLFSLGSVVGMMLMCCADPPEAKTALECQAIVIRPFLLGDLGDVTLNQARALVRDIRRCAGKDTVSIEEADPFGIDEHPTTAAAPDAGGVIFRGRL